MKLFDRLFYFCLMQLRHNIYKLYVIKTAKWFSLIMPIVVLFFQENDLTMTQIFILKAVYSVGMLVLEIPSGYFGDVWGRKKTLMVGTMLTTAGFMIYTGSYGFWQFLVAELILGIGQSFISGADSAMLYDTLKSEKRENEYLKYEGRVISVGNFSEAIAGILGGLLATISLRTPYVVQVFVSAAAIPAAFTLIEPKLDLPKRVAGLKDIFNVVKHALVVNTQLRNFIYLSSLIGAATLTYAWFIQPYLIALKLPVATFGIIWTLLNLTVGFSSIFAHRIEKHFTQVQTTGFIVISIALGFMLTAAFVSIWAIPLLFLFYLIRGIATPVLKDYINVMIDSENRATVLSLRNMFIRIIFAITGPILGWITDHFSLQAGLAMAGCFFLVTGLILFICTYSLSSSCKPS
ncbi:MAG: MFS transporter [Prolixibacteraceae bacterium]|nr:MFS transporter [Prolixibacteraceae bacterium]